MNKSKILKGVAVIGIILLLWQITRMVFIAPGIETIFFSREWDSELGLSLLGLVLLLSGAYFSKKLEE